MRFVYVAASALSLAALFPNIGSAQGLQFIPITPCRVADTRNPTGTFGGPEIPAGQTRSFPVQSSCGVPSTAAAYALNVTVVPDAQLGYLTIWPEGQNQPLVSTLNSDGRIKANAAIVPAGTPNGGVSVFVTDQTQVIIDIDGYFVPDGTAGALQFYPMTPCRITDTRGGQDITGGQSRAFTIAGAPCNVPTGASAFSLNFTAVPHGPLSYITVWPSDQNQPNASTLNASTGAITANAAIVPGAAGSGSVSVYASNDTDLIIDINGYFAAPGNGGMDFFNLNPCRVLDTRSNNGQPFSGVLPVNVAASACGAPGSAQAFVLNATVVPPGSLTYLTLWPDGQQQPVVSTLNALDAAITSNMAVVPSANGSVDAFASNPTQLILDISGYFGPSNAGGGGTLPTACSGPPCVYLDSTAVGDNLQTLINVNFSPALSAATSVTLSTDQPSLIAFSGSAGVAGGSSYTFTQAAGTSNNGIYIQALAGSGTANIWATVAGYGTNIGVVNLFPSAFILSSPSGVGAPFTVGPNGLAQLSVSAARLDGNNNFAATQQVRAGENFTVSLNVANAAAGAVSPSSLTFAGGNDTMSTQFTAGNTPNVSSLISINEPTGFVTPANNASQVTVNVGSISLYCTDTTTTALNLASQASCTINGAAPVDTVITLTSTNPSALLLSPNLSTPGSGSISVTIRAGTSSTAPFYLIGAAGTGMATYNASSALGSYTANVTLLRSGFVLEGPGGVGGTFPTTFPGAPTVLTVFPVSLDGSGNPLLALPLAPGISASVTVSSNNQNVGTVSGSPVTLNGGDSSGTVYFQPTGFGSATISASATGYTTPSSGSSVSALVSEPLILVTPLSIPVGQNLEVQNTAILSAPPSGNLTVTLTANGSILLSATGTDAGASSINITVPAGQQSFLFYIYGQGSSGTATVTASASGFNPGNTTVTLGPSGFVISGTYGAAPVFTTPLSAGPQTLSIQPAVLDSNNNFIATENLAGSKGAVAVSIANQNTNAGSVPNSVTVPVGNPGTVTFNPAQSGQQTTITLGQPSGFNAPAQSASNPQGYLTVFVQ